MTELTLHIPTLNHAFIMEVIVECIMMNLLLVVANMGDLGTISTMANKTFSIMGHLAIHPNLTPLVPIPNLFYILPARVTLMIITHIVILGII